MAHAANNLSAYLKAEISEGAFPGAQYVIGERGEIIAEDALGLAVVEPERLAVTRDTIYDLASLTKPLVTSLLAVILTTLGVIDLRAPLGEYLSEFDGERRRRLTLKQLLTHISGLPNWRPLYLEVSRPQDTPAYIARLYDEAADPNAAPVVYSDLNYILLGCAIERATGKRLDQLAQKEIFAPLGLQRTMFNPPAALQREIAATEHGQAFEQANALCDAQSRGLEGATELPPREWRNAVIWGEVHDGNAHFLGGIAGHAGLFSTAREVFQIANQFLPGSRLVKPESLRLFTENLTADCGTSRSIGWIVASGGDCSAGPVLPETAIGHNGFTGTSVWMAPEQRRVLVLLTNRIHPRVSTIEMKTVRQRFNTLAFEELNCF